MGSGSCIVAEPKKMGLIEHPKARGGLRLLEAEKRN